MRQFYLLLFFCISLSFFGNAQTVTTIADDNANNYGTSWAGDGGTGFDSWVFRDFLDGGSAGVFLEQSADAASPAISTNNKSLGTFANNAGFPRVTAYRGFDEALIVGDTLTVEIQHGGITGGGSMGFTLRTGNNNAVADDYNNGSRFEFAFIGGQSNYSIFADQTTDSGIGFTSGGLRIEVTLIAENIVDVIITELSNSNETILSGITLGGTADSSIESIALFNRSARDANVYFNNLTIKRKTFNTIAAGDFESTGTWENDAIPDGEGRTNINHAVTINSDVQNSGDFRINSSNVLTIGPGHSLKFTGKRFTNNGGLLMTSLSNEYSSFIPSQSSRFNGSGSFDYIRHTNSSSDGNDLISPPVSGDTFGAFAGRNSNLTSNDAPNEDEKLFGPFNVQATTPAYVNWTVGTDDNEDIEPGKGYRAATVSGDGLQFIGSILNDDSSVSIFNGGETNFRSWNLLGNPFSAYLNLELLLLNTTNIASLDPSFQALYFYNAGTGNSSYPGATTNGIWTIINIGYFLPLGTNQNASMAPGQGFFVKAKTGGGSFEFEEMLRRTATESASSDDAIFGRNANPDNFARTKVALTTSDNLSEIDLYFLDNATLGLDPGYDVGGFGGGGLGLFTYLLEDDMGQELAIQALPYSVLNSITIPLGINASSGVEFTLSLNDVYTALPEGVNLYLDDISQGTSTLLNDSDFVFTPNSDLNGTGRFELRFEGSALSVPQDALNRLTINVTNHQITISGVLEQPTTARIYDLQGRVVLSQDLDKEVTLQTIDGHTLSASVYIVELANGEVFKTQKVIIN